MRCSRTAMKAPVTGLAYWEVHTWMMGWMQRSRVWKLSTLVVCTIYPHRARFAKCIGYTFLIKVSYLTLHRKLAVYSSKWYFNMKTKICWYVGTRKLYIKFKKLFTKTLLPFYKYILFNCLLSHLSKEIVNKIMFNCKRKYSFWGL